MTDCIHPRLERDKMDRSWIQCPPNVSMPGSWLSTFSYTNAERILAMWLGMFRKYFLILWNLLSQETTSYLVDDFSR